MANQDTRNATMPVIRVSGDNGAGKTTLCVRLSKHLGFGYSYAGGIFRAMAKERDLSIEEFYAMLDAEPELEREVDRRQEQLMKTMGNLIVEGRMAPFLPCPFTTINLFLEVGELEGARRQTLRPENRDKSTQEMLALSRERIRNERIHYRELYGISDHLDQSCFDIVIDTTELSIDEVFETVARKLTPLLGREFKNTRAF